MAAMGLGTIFQDLYPELDFTGFYLIPGYKCFVLSSHTKVQSTV